MLIDLGPTPPEDMTLPLSPHRIRVIAIIHVIGAEARAQCEAAIRQALYEAMLGMQRYVDAFLAVSARYFEGPTWA